MTVTVEQRSRLGASERGNTTFDAATITPAGERAMEILTFLNDLFDGLTTDASATPVEPPPRSLRPVERFA